MSSSQDAREIFDKYESHGASSWKERDRRSGMLNPALVANRQTMVDQMRSTSCIFEFEADDDFLAALLAESSADATEIEVDSASIGSASRAPKNLDNCAVTRMDSCQLPFPRCRPWARSAGRHEDAYRPASAAVDILFLVDRD